MKKFIIERILPDAAMLSTDELRDIARQSCEVITSMQQPYHWIESFITDDKIFCVHIAANESVVREHARLANIPIHTVTEVKSMLDPTHSNLL